MRVGVLPRAPVSQGVMSEADGLPRKEEDAGAMSATLTIFGRQADISWLHLSRKQDRLRRGRSITDAFRHSSTLNERKTHEIHNPLPKPIAPSPELQTKSCYSNSTGAEAEPGVPPRAPVWREAAVDNRLVA